MHSSRQSGFSLIEVTIALIILMALAALGVTIMQDSSRRQEAAATGDWLRVIAGAAKAYERNNTSALLASAGPTSPAVVNAAQLLPLLPRGFNVTGPQGHTFTVRWLEPTAGRL
ncbi:type II secretion system protein, partial [Xanthomonas nasturtii]